MNGVTESAEVSVEVLLIWQPTAFDISDDSRASSSPIAYSSLPSGSERLAQLSDLWEPKAFCHTTGRERRLHSSNEA